MKDLASLKTNKWGGQSSFKMILLDGFKIFLSFLSWNPVFRLTLSWIIPLKRVWYLHYIFCKSSSLQLWDKGRGSGFLALVPRSTPNFLGALHIFLLLKLEGEIVWPELVSDGCLQKVPWVVCGKPLYLQDLLAETKRSCKGCPTIFTTRPNPKQIP